MRKVEFAGHPALRRLVLAPALVLRGLPKLAVRARRPCLRLRLGLATTSAKAGGHPLPRAEDAFEQSGQPKIGIEPGEIQSEARGRDFNDFEIGPLGCLQPLGLTSRKGKLSSSAQLYRHSIVSRIVLGSHRHRLRGPAALRARNRAVKKVHGCAPMHDTAVVARIERQRNPGECHPAFRLRSMRATKEHRSPVTSPARTGW